MKLRTVTPVAATIFVVLSLTTHVTAAQESRWRPFLSISPLYEGNADLDQGGDFSLAGVVTRLGATTRIGQRGSIGVTVNYDYLNYSFSSPTAFGGVVPWDDVQRYGLSVPLGVALQGGWTIGFVPGVDWFRENDADSGESIVWSAIATATKRFESGNHLGIGLGIVDGLEDTRVFPFLLVDWRLSEHWQVVNPLSAGPTGPAGLELDYVVNDAWTLGVGAAWRVTRFRLSEDGPAPNGVGEHRGVPVFFRASHNFSQQLGLHLYAGVVTGGELRVENSSGTRLSDDDFDPAPLFALTLVGRF